MPNRPLLITLVRLLVLGLGAVTSRGWSDDSRPLERTQADTRNGVAIGVNFNDSGPLRPEFPEHIFRDATDGRWPVPAISAIDLAHGLQPVAIQGDSHALSGDITKL